MRGLGSIELGYSGREVDEAGKESLFIYLSICICFGGEVFTGASSHSSVQTAINSGKAINSGGLIYYFFFFIVFLGVFDFGKQNQILCQLPNALVGGSEGVGKGDIDVGGWKELKEWGFGKGS